MWTGLGLAFTIGIGTWLVLRRMQELRQDAAMGARIDRASNESSFTVGDYSAIGSSDLFREQARQMEDRYADRERSHQAVQESLTRTDLRGRTEMKPWLEVE